MSRSAIVYAVDGLQPAQITPERMPNLAAFATEGVTFEDHHSVFPTVTRVNSVTMLTGRYPGGHGIAGNVLVWREFDPGRAIPALEPELTRLARRTGRIVLAANLADVLGAHGREFVAVGVGSNGNAYLQNPNAERSGGATIHPQFCLPRGLHGEIVDRFGPWPEKTNPDEPRLRRAVEVLTEYVVPEREPAVALLWCGEPDSSQHVAGVGSALSDRSLAAADRQLGKLLRWLRETGRDSETDVFVISDHGYSTVSKVIDVPARLQDAGFPLGGRPGGVVVAENANAVLFYIHESDPDTGDRLAAWLMEQPWCGPIVASDAMGGVPGTLAAAIVGIEGERVPDLTMSFRWDSKPNGAGYAGHAYSAGGGPGLGNHGSMSRHEQRCVLIARGPDFKSGLALRTPSGNVDLAPTILRVLGIDGGEAMDGRVLEEALEGGVDPASVPRRSEVHEAERHVGRGVYRQAITVTRAGATNYVNEGNATFGS